MKDNIRHIEVHSLAAWHALETDMYDGWILRVSGGYTGRANSINPLNASTIPLAEKLVYCHNFYTERGLQTLYRLHGAIIPQNLDSELEKLQYERYDETLVQTCDLSSFTSLPDDEFRYSNQLTDTWMMTLATLNAINEAYVPIAEQMLRHNPLTCCFASLGHKAIGLGVYSDGYIALFDIVAHPDYRGEGYGAKLVTSIMAWGKQQGAHTAYLQVVGTNVPALRLYQKLGFIEHHRYWYRRFVTHHATK